MNRRLELLALADALEQWGQPHVSGFASQGDTEVLVTGTVRNYSLVINEPFVFVTEPEMIHV